MDLCLASKLTYVDRLDVAAKQAISVDSLAPSLSLSKLPTRLLRASTTSSTNVREEGYPAEGLSVCTHSAV